MAERVPEIRTKFILERAVGTGLVKICRKKVAHNSSGNLGRAPWLLERTLNVSFSSPMTTI
jgi:hypothetical protein